MGLPSFLETLITMKNHVGGKWLASSNERGNHLYLVFMTEAYITLIVIEHDYGMSVAGKFRDLHLQPSADLATTLSQILYRFWTLWKCEKTMPYFLYLVYLLLSVGTRQ
jgi:hypothetical protein